MTSMRVLRITDTILFLLTRSWNFSWSRLLMDTVGKVSSLVTVNRNAALVRQNTLYQNSQSTHHFLGRWNIQSHVRRAATRAHLCTACLSKHAADRIRYILYHWYPELMNSAWWLNYSKCNWATSCATHHVGSKTTLHMFTTTRITVFPTQHHGPRRWSTAPAFASKNSFWIFRANPESRICPRHIQDSPPIPEDACLSCLTPLEKVVIPLKKGIHALLTIWKKWIPAFAGMTLRFFHDFFAGASCLSLIVENYYFLKSFLTGYLDEHGYVLLTAANAENGLEELARNHPFEHN